MFEIRTRAWWMLALSISLMLASWLHEPLAAWRLRDKLVQRVDASGLPPEYVLSNALLGGFRSLAVQALWRRAQEMKNEGQFHEMIDIYNIITTLQPGHHQAWLFQAWDLIYNVSVQFPSQEDRVFWFFRGVDLLRVQGIPRNDRIAELPAELAYIFKHKLGETLDGAHPWYRARLARQMQDIFGMPFEAEAQSILLANIGNLPVLPADFERLPGFTAARERLLEVGVDLWGDRSALRTQPGEEGFEALYRVYMQEDVQKALLATQYWRIGQHLRSRVGMEPARMLALVERHGDIDWRVGYAHSLYWADIAYDIWWAHPEKLADLKYERNVYFALIDMSRAGRGVWGADGYMHYMPDFSKVEAVSRHIENIIPRFRNWTDRRGIRPSLIGTWMAYHHFLLDAIYRAYFEDRIDHVQLLLRRIVVNQWHREHSGYYATDATREQQAIIERGNYDEIREFMDIPREFRGSVQDIIRNNLEEFLETPDLRRTLWFMESHAMSAYRALALGNQNRYEMLQRMLVFLYREYCMKRWPNTPADPDRPGDLPSEYFVPPLNDIKANALTRLFDDRIENVQFTSIDLRDYEGEYWRDMRGFGLLDQSTPISNQGKSRLRARLQSLDPAVLATADQRRQERRRIEQAFPRGRAQEAGN